ncbi:hypothetical protein L0P88_17935 [Muricauda sp. SCSIO 64092]|uniref:hypothetical protein n=1 Tax=Allomuricauda sp. SCSIO 64092 TaxID=2908842 RepID=UPI001FF43814|nr:hypothetical protein [Muricauda sp. SCSIO 64092]UOY05808.1 hypothetical protein L0P88_17935 [Muricauda sp. SCSIO 64092]
MLILALIMNLFNFLKNKPKFSSRRKLNKKEERFLQESQIDILELKRLFGKLILSEILPDEKDKSAPGIVFSGIRTELDQFFNLRQELRRCDLGLQVSLDTISSRYRSFKFDPYNGSKPIEEHYKQLYKIRILSDQDEFIDQLAYYGDDKSIVKEAYEKWVDDFGVLPIWADGKDNLLLCTKGLDENSAQSIFEQKFKIYPSYGHDIEKGWMTRESITQEINEALPIIHLCFDL